MKIPQLHKLQYENAEKVSEETISVHIDPQAYIDDIGLFEDKKEYVRWIIRMKQNIRGSIKYQEMMSFVKKKRRMFDCVIHPILTTWYGLRIEIHHSLFFLYDVLTIVT